MGAMTGPLPTDHTELVVLFNGNHLCIRVDPDARDSIDALMAQALRQQADGHAAHVVIGQHFFNTTWLIGYYWRAPLNTTREQLDIQKRLVAAVERETRQDEFWRNEDEE